MHTIKIEDLALLLIFTTFLPKLNCVSKFDWSDLLEICRTRDIILVSENSDKLSSLERKFWTAFTTSQITLLNYYSTKLGHDFHSDQFRETIVIVSNFSLVQNFLSNRKASTIGSRGIKSRYAKMLFLTDESHENLMTQKIQQFTAENLPDLTDVFFGDSKGLFGLSCVKNECVSMKLEYYLKRRKSFLGVPLKLAIVRDWENLVALNSNDSMNLYKTSQEINDDLLDGMMPFLNFTTMLYTTSDWAVLHKNGSWDGMAKLVDSGETDIGLSRTYLLPYRVKHFRFLVVVSSENLVAYYHPAARINADIIADCDFRIWLIVLAEIVIGVCILKLIWEIDVTQSILLVVATISQQGPPDAHHHCANFQQSSRTMSLILNLSGFVFYAMFSALLVSSFSIEANMIKVLEDLFTRGFTFGILHDSYLTKEDAEQISTTPRNTALGKIMSNLDRKQKIATLDDGSRSVLTKENFAFLSEINLYGLFPNYTNAEICNGVEDLVIEEEVIKSAAFVMKDSPYAEYLNFAYLTMWERGMTPRIWKSDAMNSLQLKPSCPEVSKAVPIDFVKLWTAFLISLVGIILSFLAFCLEQLVSRIRKDKIKLTIWREGFTTEMSGYKSTSVLKMKAK